jgi:C-terminal processing protease CtpA/Prc
MAQIVAQTREEINDRALTKFTKRVRESVSLSHFAKEFESKGKLPKAQRLQMIEQAQVLLEMNYAHLPLKRARHAVDPIQRLKRLKFLIGQTKTKDLPSEIAFHHQMQRVFFSTRDNHTNYSLPSPFKDRAAFLPFIIEEYFVKNGAKQEPRYMVSRVAERYMRKHLYYSADRRYFARGVEVLYWNGIPIRRAIELNAQKQAGSNHEARFARGLDSMTIRPFNVSLPPDEQWVVITYRSNGRRPVTRDIKLRWRVYRSKPDKADLPKSAEKAKRHVSLDPQKSSTNYIRWNLFHRPQDPEISASGTFRTNTVAVGERQFGYIRILTFDRDDQALVKEFIRLLRGLPPTGLIIDVRGNGGGCIEAGERLLQLLTPRRIEPSLFEFLNTPLNLEVSRRADEDTEYDRWQSSIAEAGETGEVHSRALPITHEELCNDIGQIYYGPVVLITDALCYSATDMFAAGFQDNQIGEILGASSNTGAGGANVVKHKDLVRWMKDYPDSPYRPLPKRMTMRVSLLRSLRVGRYAERPLEELGVIPDVRHYMTKNDLLNRNEDLINKAVDMLKFKPIYNLSVKAKRNSDGTGTVIAETTNISFLDVYIDNRPLAPSHRTNTQGDRVTFRNVSLAGRLPKLVIEGYSRGRLVAKSMTRSWKRA